jgi:hypothetical protein
LAVVGVWTFITVLCVLATPDVRAGESAELTPAARAAVEKLYPTGSIVGVGHEREHGVRYYEVAVRDGEERIEVEVTEDGVIGEIESPIELMDVPVAARVEILRLTEGARHTELERHEIRGIPKGDTFMAIDPPMVVYEVEYERDGLRKEVTLGPTGHPFPQSEHEDPDTDDGSSDDDSSDDDSSSDDEDADATG